MKNLLLSAICIVSLFLSSCQNWIDVNPKTDIEAEEFFTSEDGFKSALTGLYSMMVLEKSYGRQMTFDFVEKLVQRYDNYELRWTAGICFHSKKDKRIGENHGA